MRNRERWQWCHLQAKEGQGTDEYHGLQNDPLPEPADGAGPSQHLGLSPLEPGEKKALGWWDFGRCPERAQQQGQCWRVGHGVCVFGWSMCVDRGGAVPVVSKSQ